LITLLARQNKYGEFHWYLGKSALTSLQPAASQTYVKGYAIDYTKIKDLIGATDVTDLRIGYIEYQIHAAC
jgi:hypothetical protein